MEKCDQHDSLVHEYRSLDSKIDSVMIGLGRIETLLKAGYVTKDVHNKDMGKIHEKINRTVFRLFIIVVGMTGGIASLISYIMNH